LKSEQELAPNIGTGAWGIGFHMGSVLMLLEAASVAGEGAAPNCGFAKILAAELVPKIGGGCWSALISIAAGVPVPAPPKILPPLLLEVVSFSLYDFVNNPRVRKSPGFALFSDELANGGAGGATTGLSSIGAKISISSSGGGERGTGFFFPRMTGLR
jgi:hypothetical protein